MPNSVSHFTSPLVAKTSSAAGAVRTVKGNGAAKDDGPSV
jgi:hypothetical protein